MLQTLDLQQGFTDHFGQFVHALTILLLLLWTKTQLLHEVDVIEEETLSRHVEALVVNNGARVLVFVGDTLLLGLNGFVPKLFGSHEGDVQHTTENLLGDPPLLDGEISEVQVKGEEFNVDENVTLPWVTTRLGLFLLDQEVAPRHVWPLLRETQTQEATHLGLSGETLLDFCVDASGDLTQLVPQ